MRRNESACQKNPACPGAGSLLIITLLLAVEIINEPMAKRLIIAEKPSVAADIARTLGGLARQAELVRLIGSLKLEVL